MRLPRNAHAWLPDYLRWSLKRLGVRQPQGLTHILLCICDHYEPGHGNPGLLTERVRVQRWTRDFPPLAGGFTDADGRHPRHTFFYPIEQYRHEHLDALRDLCAAGYGEVEVHLHHDRDTSAHLRVELLRFRDLLAGRYGLLGRDATGAPVYGFIHGNWALDNSRPDGRWCGVDDELTILRETGCYADFTLPSAPSDTQTRTINSIYYAIDDPRGAKSHDTGVPAQVGLPAPPEGLLMIQGPLRLTWRRRKYGVLPTLDTGSVDASAGCRPDAGRGRQWIDAAVSVRGRPDWVFVKLHTHGAIERNADVLLGDEMRRCHEGLLREFNDGRRFAMHYVTAREMANLVRAAEQGASGNPAAHRNSWIGAPPLTEVPAAGNDQSFTRRTAS